MDIIGAGRTLYFYKEGYAKPHLWLVLTDPKGDDNKFVAVMVKTRMSKSDSTTILVVGDHPFITHESCVDYGTADFFFVGNIQRKFSKGNCSLREDMSQSLLKLVRQGLLISPHTVHAIRDYCEARFQSE